MSANSALSWSGSVLKRATASSFRSPGAVVIGEHWRHLAIVVDLSEPGHEHIMLYNMEGELDPSVDAVDISSAKVRRPGTDITLVTYGGSLFKTLDAATALAQEGIEADFRSLRPLDMETVVASVAKTRRVLIVDEGRRSGSIWAEIGMRLVEQACRPPCRRRARA